MPLEMQGKLLRVLQAGEMQAGRRRGDPEGPRAGDRGHQPRPREGARRRGEFREDLFYRFNAFTIVAAAPARARGGHPGPRLSLPPQGRGQGEQEGGSLLPGGARSAEALSVARQSARAGEHHRARGGARLEPAGRGRAISRSTSRSRARSGSPREEGFVRGQGAGGRLFEREAVARFLAEARGNISLAAKRAGSPVGTSTASSSKYSINTKNFRTETS